MNTPASDYGQNTWLVEEMYQQYQKDPNSVDPSWREVLKDYRPSPNGEPAAAPLTSQQPNAVTLDATGANTIDGAGTYPLASQWDTVHIASNGTAWFVV